MKVALDQLHLLSFSLPLFYPFSLISPFGFYPSSFPPPSSSFLLSFTTFLILLPSSRHFPQCPCYCYGCPPGHHLTRSHGVHCAGSGFHEVRRKTGRREEGRREEGKRSFYSYLHKAHYITLAQTKLTI